VPQQGERIQDRARGRWKDILSALGFPLAALSGRHCACPWCGGKDRFRWDDKEGSGSWFCSQCGAGHGVEAVIRWRKCEFSEAKEAIEKVLGQARVRMPSTRVASEDQQGRMGAGWAQATRLNGMDPASRWLEWRLGKALETWPTQLRVVSKMPYGDRGSKVRTFHPAMVARFVSPDAQHTMLHRTYLRLDGRGKADVREARMFAPGSIPEGGAVRLANSAPAMGIATGIETSLAAMLLFKIPVWATLNDALLVKWIPPETVRNITIFGDNDVKFGGAMAAFGLAHKLACDRRYSFIEQIDVRIPDHIGQDFNDVLREDMGLPPLAALAEEQQKQVAAIGEPR
jgi:putative DNA primase/helicase